jgi:Tol biopolymer transport system component
MTLTAGSRLGPYEIRTRIGAGGMGEVYRARDTKLERDVAIKILPRAFTSDPERLARFEREARMLATLNHPNIGSIYGLEDADGIRALVLELIDGETLADRIARGPLALNDALPIASQIAEALDAAHERGIVHRDLKPANIKITPDGVVKVIDFGLAKAASAEAAAADLAQSPTVTVGGTREGVILGTAAYMSPEQARGQTVDKRSDIWAFGCVLYEMLTGHVAFARDTIADTLAAIVEREPDWSALPASIPATIRRLLSRCLEKGLKRRLRDIADVRFAIEDSATDGRHPAVPAVGRSARRLWFASLATMVLVTALGTGWWTARRSATIPENFASVADVTLVPLTTDPGYNGEPTFAPDGETVAYVSDRTGNFEIFLRQASGGRDINLTNDAADDVQPAFSPDGRQIAFVSSRAGGSAVQFVGMDYPLLGGGIWVMPALGGSARRVAERGNFPSWSPDGKSIVYTAGPWFGKKIYIVPAIGGAPEEIPVKLQPTQHWMYASYSPDGRWIVFEAAPADIYIVPASGGEPHRVAGGHHPLWNANGTAIVYSSEEPGRNYSLWQVPVSTAEARVTGPPQPITVGRGRDLPGSVSRDGRRVAFTAQDQSFNLEVMPFNAETGRPLGKPEPLTVGNQLIFFLSFSPDGHSIAFDSRRGAESHLWRLDRGSSPQALISDSAFSDGFPRWSPDGRGIVFNRRSSANRQANFDLWHMATDGGNPRELVKGTANGGTAWFPDGSHVVYHKNGQLQRLNLATGQSLRLTNEPGVMPIMVVSPDGKWVVYQSTASGNVDLRAVSTEGGPSRVVVATSYEDYHPSFSPSARWLYFQPDHKNLVRVPWPAQEGSLPSPEQVTHFPDSGLLIEDIQPSPDGRQLAFARGLINSDVWILNLR